MREWSVWTAALVLVAAAGQSAGETRVSVAVAASEHPESTREYENAHVGIGITGTMRGRWLRWRAGMTRHSEGRIGPYAGVALTGALGRRWRAGVSAGAIGNYARRQWIRAGVVPIAQWRAREGAPVWEFALARVEGVTFAGVSVQIPLEGD